MALDLPNRPTDVPPDVQAEFFRVAEQFCEQNPRLSQAHAELILQYVECVILRDNAISRIRKDGEMTWQGNSVKPHPMFKIIEKYDSSMRAYAQTLGISMKAMAAGSPTDGGTDALKRFMGGEG
jgi:phage terminase small subunit